LIVVVLVFTILESWIVLVLVLMLVVFVVLVPVFSS
jgi:hypothetical protein